MVPLLALVLAGGTSGGLVWRIPTGDNSAEFAFADRGGQVYVERTDDPFLLLSAFDSSPPTSVWQHTAGWGAGRVRCASTTDVAVRSAGRFLGDKGPVQFFLQLYRSNSPAPVWIHPYTPQDWSFPMFDVSADGRTVVSAFTVWDSQPITTVRVHDPDTGIPLRAFEVQPEFDRQLDLSSDGSTLAISGGTYDHRITRLLDLRTEAALFQTEGDLPPQQAISRDGSVFAVVVRDGGAGVGVRAFARGPSGYALVLDRPAREGVWFSDCAVSDDGSTVVISWYDHRTPTRSIVCAYDVASGAQTMEDVLVAQSLQDPAYGLAICADGSRFVLGSWGDGAGTLAELAVYARDRDVPLAEYPDGGSVQEVDISPDGRRFVAARALTHVNAGYHGMYLDLYELGGEDLAVRGRPSIGSTITLEAHAAPGSTAYLLFARALAPVPIEVPGVGVLYLDPATLARRPLGSVPPSGVVAVPVSIPNDAAAVGEKVYYQVLSTNPRALGRDFAQVTILP